LDSWGGCGRADGEVYVIVTGLRGGGEVVGRWELGVLGKPFSFVREWLRIRTRSDEKLLLLGSLGLSGIFVPKAWDVDLDITMSGICLGLMMGSDTLLEVECRPLLKSGCEWEPGM